MADVSGGRSTPTPDDGCDGKCARYECVCPPVGDAPDGKEQIMSDAEAPLVCKVCCQECTQDEMGADGACLHCWDVYGDKWLK